MMLLSLSRSEERLIIHFDTLAIGVQGFVKTRLEGSTNLVEAPLTRVRSVIHPRNPSRSLDL